MDKEKSKKCLLITTHFRPLIGGAQAVYDAIAAEMPDCITVLTATTDYNTGKDVPNWRAFDDSVEYSIIRVPETRPRFRHGGMALLNRAQGHLDAFRISYNLRKAIQRALSQENYDAICIGALDALGYLIPWLRTIFPGPVLLYTHGEEICQKAYSERAEARRRNALLSVDGIVAVSSFTRDLLISKYDIKDLPIEVITNGVDLERFTALPRENIRQKFGIGHGPLVVAVGRLVERKGFDKLLGGWPKVRAAVPSAELAIGGMGPLEGHLKALSEAEEMQGSAHILGMVPDELLPSLYASADLFAMPNRTMPDGDTEGFGLVFLEAAAAGTPAIGGRAGGVPDAIIDGQTGVLVDGEDESAIAFAVSELLTDEVRRKAMGQAAREHALSQGWAAKALQFQEFVNHLVTEKTST